MSSAKFTLIGAYQFYHNAGGDLFENMSLPEGINKDTLTSNILLQGGEFEVQHGNPIFIHDAIAIWSSAYQETFERWVNALAIEYAPLENYDRMEHWTDERDTTGSLTGSGTSNTTGTLDTTYDETVDYDAEVERTKSAYDSSTYQPYDKEVTDATTGTHAVTDTDTSEHNTTSVSNNTTGSDDSEHNGRVHGNIGVTTSQQMLNQELDLGYWNLYQRITQLFLQEFVIPVYE